MKTSKLRQTNSAQKHIKDSKNLFLSTSPLAVTAPRVTPLVKLVKQSAARGRRGKRQKISRNLNNRGWACCFSKYVKLCNR
nr:unnamed protein product [Callosobruchus chinensis]